MPVAIALMRMWRPFVRAVEWFMSLVGLGFAGLLVGACTNGLPHQQGVMSRPTPIDTTDFRVGPIALFQDSLVVKGRLGRPDSISYDEQPFRVGDTLMVWWYSGMRLEMGAVGLSGVVQAIMTRTNEYRTRRGLGIGDTEARVLQLYGSPVDRSDDQWHYDTPRAGVEFVVSLAAGKVTQIYIGVIFD